MRAIAYALCLAALAACGGSTTTMDGGAESGAHDMGGTDAPRPDLAGCVDADSDGHPAMSCGGDDCDDGDANRYPGNVEVCDAMDHDEDCDPLTFGSRDADGDGHVDATCCNGSPSGPHCGDDCNDMNPSVHPSATETCNGLDDNCNGMIDEGVIPTWYADCDHDGYGGSESLVQCLAPTTAPTSCSGGLWIGVGGDCQDSMPAIHPGAVEICNGVDDDCSGTADDGADAYCSSLPNVAAGTCASSSCSISSCAGAFLDCDMMSGNGCEIPGATDPRHCGSCTGVCAFACTASACDAAVEVSAGTTHTCARTASGAVACWGDDTYGQLGDGSSATTRSVPARVPGITDAIQIAAGFHHTCVLHADSTVSCWGDDSFGEIGDGTADSTPRTSPVAVAGLTGVVHVAADGSHTCALLATGEVRCWGANTSGQLGDGTTTFRPSPVAVSGIADAVSIAVGQNHSCAALSSGTVQCWGNNFDGAIGDGTNTDRYTPQNVHTSAGTLSGGVEVVAGAGYSCARLSGGGVDCWGRNSHGQLGDGSVANSNVAVAVGPLGVGFIAITSHTATSSFDGHVCVYRASGAQCWGTNGAGELGDGTTTERHVPTYVTSIMNVDQVSAGGDHTCMIYAGSLSCWGLNNFGQLGNGTMTDSTYPVLATLGP